MNACSFGLKVSFGGDISFRLKPVLRNAGGVEAVRQTLLEVLTSYRSCV
jgi:hypothetical protein